MIPLYMDENVNGAIVRGLRARGVNILTVVEDGLSGASDPDVLDRATELGRVLFSEDEDRLREATLRQREGLPFGGVIYAHTLYISVGDCIDGLELIAGARSAGELANQVRFLPLR